VANYHAAGLHAKLLDATALYRHEPNLRPGLPGGLRIAGDAVVYPSRSAAWLWQQTGGTLIHAQVSAIHVGGVTLTDGRHLSADAIVLATGSRARDLVPALPIRPKKGHLVITDRYPGFIHHQVAEMGYVKNAHLADVDSVAFNVQPRATGQILIGSCRQYDIHTPEVDPIMLGRMLQRCLEFMPALATLSSIRVWTGYRAATPDGQPLIGPHPHQPGLWLATGHEGLGITTSLGTADLLAALMNQTTPAITPTPIYPVVFLHRHDTQQLNATPYQRLIYSDNRLPVAPSHLNTEDHHNNQSTLHALQKILFEPQNQPNPVFSLRYMP
jgi:glycine/D-amino acid oxidase-like deaminating enzyme